MHYRRWMDHGTTDRPIPVPAATQCTVNGCDHTKKIIRGLCNMHYLRLRALGTTDLPTTAGRFAADLVWMPNGCLEWTGTINKSGYGLISIHGKPVRAHRFAWELVNGPIPPGLFACHKCDNPPCCNVEHLFLGTHDDNMVDMAVKNRSYNGKKTHCPQGHEYTDANTYTWHGDRECRECGRASTARYLRRKKGLADAP